MGFDLTDAQKVGITDIELELLKKIQEDEKNLNQVLCASVTSGSHIIMHIYILTPISC